jgi:selenocysteine lyase/cysteine desulfurase
MVFYAFPFQPGDRIVTAQNEYSSNYIAFLQRSRRTGAEIVALPPSDSGEIDLEALEQTLKAGGVKLVALTHIATNNGMVQPAAEVGRLTRHFGVPFLLDACQSVGQMNLDVDALGCDMLSAAGRKFLRGPRGTGFLYVRRSLLPTLEPPFLDNHSAEWSATDAYTMRDDARRFELFESSAALALGLGAAAEYAMRIGLDRIEVRVQQLAATLRHSLSRVEDIHVTDSGTVKSGVVMFLHERVQSAELVAQLAARGITVRLGGRFSTRLDARLSAMDDLVRASIHYYNTEEEIERFSETLSEVVGQA